jgi:guanylate kinase
MIMNVVISAPSGSGKTTIINELMSSDPRFEFSVSTTTREKRNGEEEGKDYHYIKPEEFENMIEHGEFLEWAIVHGNYYGTLKKEIDRISDTGNIPIFDVDVQGGLSLKKKLDDAVFIFIIPPSRTALKERLIQRKTDHKDIIELRLRNAEEELKSYQIYDYIVVNDDLDGALERLKSIIAAEFCRLDRMKNFITNWRSK